MIYFDTFTKMPKNVGDLGKLIVAKGFKKSPKVQKIAKSGHTESIGENPSKKNYATIFLSILIGPHDRP